MKINGVVYAFLLAVSRLYAQAMVSSDDKKTPVGGALETKVDTLEKVLTAAISNFPGPKGVKGDQGSQGVQGLRGLPGKKGDLPLPDTLLDALSVTYTRWGRTRCPTGAEIVYDGFTGGSFFTNFGGGVGYQCMPKDPNYDEIADKGGVGSFMYTSEYEVSQFASKTGVRREDDVPCVVCRVKRKSSLLMIPAKNVCPSGWRREYSGYLMTAAQSHAHPQSFECMDREPEAISNSHSNTNGALFYFVGSKCTGRSLCHGYKQDVQLTCAVCTI